MGVAKYKYNEDFLNNKNENYWYIAGLLASDGYISDESIEIGLNKKDFDIINKIKNIMCPNKPIYYKETNNAYILKLNKKEWSQHYKQLFSMETNNKHKELLFPTIPNKYLKDFIRGYIDGDGCIDKAKGKQKINDKFRYYYGVRLRILGNYNFLKELNLQTKRFINHKTNAISKKGKENVYVITYNFSTAKNILNWVYQDNPELYLERKHNKFLELLT